MALSFLKLWKHFVSQPETRLRSYREVASSHGWFFDSVMVRSTMTPPFFPAWNFCLIGDHHIQRGPSFLERIDIFINAVTGQITSPNRQGEIAREHLDLPADVANGLPPNLLINLLPSDPETKLSFVAPTEKRRLIHFSIKPVGEVPFTIGNSKRTAIDYLIHVELGGLTGVIAPIICKQPDNSRIWILGGPSPAFIREEGQLYEGGPTWHSVSFRQG